MAATHGDGRIAIVDAYSNESGHTVVVVRAQTGEEVDDVRIRYENQTDVIGPLSYDNGGVVDAYVANASKRDEDSYGGNGFSNQTGDSGMVRFVLNDSASYEQSTLTLNASTGGTAYENADAANRSVLTANAHRITLQNATGSQLSGSTPVFLYNRSSETLRGTALATGGSAGLHCGGALDGDTCVDPDSTDDPHIYASGATAAGPKTPTPYPTTLSGAAFRLSTANATPRADLPLNETTTLRTNQSGAPYEFFARERTGGDASFADEIRIRNRTSDEVVYRWRDGVTPNRLALLRPKTPYEVVFENATRGETRRRYVTVPTKGMAQQVFLLPDDDQSTPTTRVSGQVVNESGDPVPNVVVAAERMGDPSPELRTFNSTTTGGNGTFSMRLPESDPTNVRYQFRLTSNRTSDGRLQYYPTTDGNDWNGYVVHERQTVLPTLELKRGGEVDVNVTNATGGTVPTPMGLSSLSQTSDRTGDRARTALTESLGLFQLGPIQPEQILVRQPSPTTGAQSNVGYNMWGLAPPNSGGPPDPSYVCADQFGVSQSETTDSACALEEEGVLAISLTQHEGIVGQTGDSRALPAGQADAYFRNELIVRNASTGNVTTYLGPGSIQPFLLEDSETPYTLGLPVPPGNYTVELRPTEQFQDRTTVRETSNYTVTAGAETTADLDSGRDFLIEPVPEASDVPFRRTADNSLAIRVGDPATEQVLTDSNISVSVRFKYLNGTLAADEDLTYESSIQAFNRSDITPADSGLDAGLYILELRASHENGTRTYNTTVRDGMVVSDFATDVRVSQRVAAPEGTVRTDLRAFDLTTDPPAGIDASADNVTVTLYDQAGNQINETTADEGVDGGYGSVELTAPENVGRYRMSVVVENDSGQQGYATTWIRVAEASLDVSVNQSVYRPDDPVELTATVEDASGDPIGDATVETTVSGTTNSSTTDASTGEATLVLDPAQIADGEWDGTTFVEVKATVQHGGDVASLESGQRVVVRPFDIRTRPTRPQFQSGNNATIDMLVPPGTNVAPDNVSVTSVGGSSIDDGQYSVTDRGGYFRIEVGSGVLASGANRVQIEATNDNGRTAGDTLRVRVASLSVRVETEHYTYQPDETVNATASVRYLNGSAIEGKDVTLTLYQIGDRPVQIDRNASVGTGSDGRATATLSTGSSATGSHVVVAEVDGQEAYSPVRVTSVNATLVDRDGSSVDTYTVDAGGEGTLNVSVTNATDGSDIDEGTIRAVVFVDGERIRLGEGEISGGTANLTFTVPSSAAGTYPLGVNVDTPDGFDRTTGALSVSGAQAIEVDADAEGRIYAPDETGTFSATVTQGGSPVADETVEFAIVSRSSERKIGTATTDDAGTATIEPTLPADLTEGEYALQVRLPDEDVRAYDGLLISQITADVQSEEPAYAVGETVNLSIGVTNRTTGANVSDIEGVVRLALPGGDEQFEPFNRSGTAPYEVQVGLPNDSELTGTQTIDVAVRNGSSLAFDSTLIQVRNDSENASLSVEEGLVAETAFETNANATLNTSATLSVYSPGTGSMVEQRDLSINESNATATSLTLGSPGTYVFELDVPGVGTDVVVRNVEGTASDPVLRVGPGLDSNATTFGTSEDVYVRTDRGNMSATIISANGTSSVALNREDGDAHYGVFSRDRAEGTYLVRLDGPNATDIDSAVLEVNDDA
ncbi:hypothetical protein [Halobellus sp. GM3]|uniref:hypothetical protein n=1 Tax=Halobellus sp. GM3 TaxID=3458410 RepID=UPI00403D585C